MLIDSAASAQTYNKTMVAGSTLNLGHFGMVKPNRTLKRKTTVRVTIAPAHGSVRLMDEKAFGDFWRPSPLQYSPRGRRHSRISVRVRRITTNECRLDDEERARVRDCLKKARLSPPHDRFERLIRDIEASMVHFLNAADEVTFRQVHDSLRELWMRSHLDRAPVQVLRDELRKLPKKAVEYMDRRAQVVIPRLFPGETIEEDVLYPSNPLAAGFLAWADTADDQELITALRVLSGEGGRVVPGRSRGGGKRSCPQFEPTIMGEVRGAGARDQRGGAPTKDAEHKLVMWLALAWLEATDEKPKPGRSDYTGFGDLVHSVFQSLELPEGSAVYALRRYWADVKREQARPKLGDF
jgi:hypothetical protein